MKTLILTTMLVFSALSFGFDIDGSVSDVKLTKAAVVELSEGAQLKGAIQTQDYHSIAAVELKEDSYAMKGAELE